MGLESGWGCFAILPSRFFLSQHPMPGLGVLAQLTLPDTSKLLTCGTAIVR